MTKVLAKSPSDKQLGQFCASLESAERRERFHTKANKQQVYVFSGLIGKKTLEIRARMHHNCGFTQLEVPLWLKIIGDRKSMPKGMPKGTSLRDLCHYKEGKYCLHGRNAKKTEKNWDKPFQNKYLVKKTGFVEAWKVVDSKASKIGQAESFVEAKNIYVTEIHIENGLWWHWSWWG